MQITGSASGITGTGGSAAGASGKTASATESFVNQLKNEIQDVNQLQNEADDARQDAAINGAKNMHETLIKVEEADISLRTFLKVRGKALDAYHEIMRMQF